jgi:hypothetical protein
MSASEGGMHHAAAAVGVPAVVLFGGFIPPEIMGYKGQISLTGGATACGNISQRSLQASDGKYFSRRGCLSWSAITDKPQQHLDEIRDFVAFLKTRRSPAFLKSAPSLAAHYGW